MKEVLRDNLGCFSCFTAWGTEERSINSSGDGRSQFINVLKSKATCLFKIAKAGGLSIGVFCLGVILTIEKNG